jgi:hypothetical protein
MIYAQAGLIACGVLWILGFVYVYLRARRRAKEAESWPAVPGRVLSSEVRRLEGAVSDSYGDARSSYMYMPAVSYAYVVGGREFEGTRIGFGKTAHYVPEKAQADIDRFPAGSTPMVRYNPENPEECVLEASPPSKALFGGAAVGLIFVLFGIYLPSLFSAPP